MRFAQRGRRKVLDLGGKRVRRIDTPLVTHCWDTGLIFEGETKTLFCSDLFAQIGEAPTTTETDILAPAIATEDAFHATSLTPATGPTIRRLADLAPGEPCFDLDCNAGLT